MAVQTNRLGTFARTSACALATAGIVAALLGVHGVRAQDDVLPLRGSLQDEVLAENSPADVAPVLDEVTTGAVPLRDSSLRAPLNAREPRVQDTDETSFEYRPFNPGALSDGEPLADARAQPVEPIGPFDDEPFGEASEAMRARAAQRLAAETELDEATTATVPLAAVDAIDLERNLRVGADAERIGSIETTRRLPQDNPFAPVGLRLGTFELFPSIEQGIGWTSNADGGADGESAFYSETVGRFDLRSDWSRHQAAINGFGIVRREISGAEIGDFEAGLDGELRLDLAYGYEARAAFGYLHRPESATAPDTVEGAVSRPDRDTLTGELGIAREVARLRLGLTGAVTRDAFSNAELSDGTVVSQKDRNSTLAVMRLRTGYEVSPALTPFAEIEAGRRIYDNEFDAAGYRRSADRVALRGGIALDVSDKWRGEAFAGWVRENPDDDAFRAISGLEFGGNIAWSPLRGTIVDLNALTSVEGATTPGASGALLYAASLSVTHELRTNLTGTAGIGIDYRDYANASAHDLTWSAQVALTWWFNRYLGLTGRARYENFSTSGGGSGSDTASVFMGLRAQR